MDKNTIFKRISAVVIFVLIVFFFLLNSRRTYVTETQILVLPKTQITAESYGKIVANLENILSSISFYDSVEKSLGENSTEDLSNYERKKLWNSQIEIEQIGKSGAINIKTFSKGALDSYDLNQIATRQAILSIGQYYNIKTDLEIRIVEKQITRIATFRNISVIIGESIIFGIMAYIFIFLVFPWFLIRNKEISRKKEMKLFLRDDLRQSYAGKFPRTIFPEYQYEFSNKKEEKKPEVKIETEKKNEKIISEKKEEIRKEKIIKIERIPKAEEVSNFNKKSASPSNLPVSEGIPDFLFSSESVEEKNEEKKNENNLKREASPEEVKERLNKLLRGE